MFKLNNPDINLLSEKNHNLNLLFIFFFSLLMPTKKITKKLFSIICKLFKNKFKPTHWINWNLNFDPWEKKNYWLIIYHTQQLKKLVLVC